MRSRLSLSKMHRTSINSRKGQAFPLALHLGHWSTVQRLPEISGEEIKNLGAQYDSQNSGKSELNRLHAKLRRDLGMVRRAQGCKDMRHMTVVKSSRRKVVGYVADRWVRS